MKKQMIPLSIFAGLVIVLAVGLTLNPKDVPSPLIGKPAAEFRLNQLGSEQSFSPSDLKGKAWVLNIWASWCASCKQEHKLLVDLVETHSTLIVGLNYKDTTDEAKAWLVRYENPYHLVVEDPSGRAGIDWGVYGVPETFVIDPQGIIRHKFTGPLTKQRIQQTLLPLLKQMQDV